MKKLVILLLIMACFVPAFAKQNVGFGFSLSGEGSGIFFMLPSQGKINPEVITSGYIREDYYNLRFGGRVLYSLGEKGIVARYTGVGAGVALFTQYDYADNSSTAKATAWGQWVLGTKVSLENSFLKAPIRIRSEVGVSISDESEVFSANTHVGFGIEYEF